MDQKQLQAIIAEFFEKLPKDAQEAFESMQWMETVEQISAIHNLNPNQIETFATETTLALLGVIHLDEYTVTLTKELALPKDLTEKIISEANEKIFKRLHTTLEDAYNSNVEDLEILDSENNEKGVSVQPIPENVALGVASLDYKQKLYQIGTKYKLNIPAMASLEEVTVKFIDGEISSTQYESSLEVATELPATTIKDIVKDVNDTILVDIRKKMQQGASVIPSVDEDADVPIPPYAHEEEKPAPIPVTPKVATSPAPAPIPVQVKNPPVVPIAQPQPIEKSAPRTEQGILANAGIEIMGPESTPDTNSSIANKFFTPVKSYVQTTDRPQKFVDPVPAQPTPVVPAPTPATPLPRTNDPYHEPIN